MILQSLAPVMPIFARLPYRPQNGFSFACIEAYSRESSPRLTTDSTLLALTFPASFNKKSILKLARQIRLS